MLRCYLIFTFVIFFLLCNFSTGFADNNLFVGLNLNTESLLAAELGVDTGGKRLSYWQGPTSRSGSYSWRLIYRQEIKHDTYWGIGYGHGSAVSSSWWFGPYSWSNYQESQVSGFLGVLLPVFYDQLRWNLEMGCVYVLSQEYSGTGDKPSNLRFLLSTGMALYWPF